MIKRKVVFRSHAAARSARLLSKTMARFKCSVFLERNGGRINAKSLMGAIVILMHNARYTAVTDGKNVPEYQTGRKCFSPRGYN